MRRASAIGALALSATGLALCGSASSHLSRPLPCPAGGGHVLARDGQVRVYRPSTLRGPVLACLVGRGTRMTLLAAGPPHHQPSSLRPGSLGMIVLSGSIVAYVVNRLTGVDTDSSELFVADVATGHILRRASVGYSVDGGLLASETLRSLAITSRGSVAWIEERSTPPHHQETAVVFAAPPTGSAILLDEGPSIGPQSLGLSHDILSWSNGATRRSAPMP